MRFLNFKRIILAGLIVGHVALNDAHAKPIQCKALVSSELSVLGMGRVGKLAPDVVVKAYPSQALYSRATVDSAGDRSVLFTDYSRDSSDWVVIDDHYLINVKTKDLAGARQEKSIYTDANCKPLTVWFSSGDFTGFGPTNDASPSGITSVYVDKKICIDVRASIEASIRASLLPKPVGSIKTEPDLRRAYQMCLRYF